MQKLIIVLSTLFKIRNGKHDDLFKGLTIIKFFKN